jgi:hypothetical protein
MVIIKNGEKFSLETDCKEEWKGIIDSEDKIINTINEYQNKDGKAILICRRWNNLSK